MMAESGMLNKAENLPGNVLNDTVNSGRVSDRAALAEIYGEGNIIQGGGNSLQIKDQVMASIAESRAGNSASHFGEYAASEQAFIAEGESGGKGTSGATNQLTLNNFIADVTQYNTQLGVLNKKKDNISGAHKQDAFLESAEILGVKINLKLTDENYPGLIEYQYQLPAKAGNGPNAGQIVGYKKESAKTTYDPAILSD